jgi:hypothetical protein
MADADEAAADILGEIKVKTVSRTKRYIAIISFLGLLFFAGFAENSAQSQDGANYKVDYASARKEIQGFETILNNTLNTTFSTAPFAVSQRTKGAYLQGYGIAFNFLINIHVALINSPFGIVKYAEVTPEQKRQRIEDLKDKLARLLMDYGDSFRQLGKEEVVTIVAFIEDRNFPDEPNQNKTVVMSVQKKDLDELAHKEARWREFKQRMKIIEY